MIVELDGCQIRDRASVHAHLKIQLGFPECYGKNLDALYDLLTERGTPLIIRLRNQDTMEDALGVYADLLISTLQQAAEENPMLEVQLEQ